MSDIFVKSLTHLKDRKSADKALTMLQKVASLVKPIMRKHGWVLPVLAEFFPDNPNLLGLNVNMGQKILVRLRHAFSPDSFMDEDSIVQTMLHEVTTKLTHNVHGPHDDKFYKYLAGLQEEYDSLQRSGYAGEGFFSKGQRLGVNTSHNLPTHQARLQAVAAAEKRRQSAQILGGGGRRLGGSIVPGKALSPQELAARAAERRIHDEKTCAQGDTAQREAEKAAQESIENKVIDLTLDDSEEESDILIVNQTPGPSKVLGSLPSQSINSSVKSGAASTARADTIPARNVNNPPPINLSTKPVRPGTRPSGSFPEWACPTCTLLNCSMALQCEACFTTKPTDRQAGWTCLTCGEVGISHHLWSCTFCGAIKLQS